MTTPTRSHARAAELRDLDAAVAAGVPDHPVRLPADGSMLACMDCGVAVDVAASGQEPVEFRAVSRQGHPPVPAVDGPPMRTYDVAMLRCDYCHARARHAARIVAAHPRISAKLGPAGALQTVLNVLNGLACLGRPAPDELTEVALASLCRRLSVPGSSAAFSIRYVPVQTAPPDQCGQYPWAHVPPSTRLQLRTGYAATLADRAAASRPVQRVAPPDGTSCVFCGVGHVDRSAQDVQALGGLGEARRILWEPATTTEMSGHLCPACAQAVESVGSVGATAMLRAFTAHLRSVGRGDDADRAARDDVRLVAWGALSANLVRRGHAAPAANETPWQHVRLEL